MADSVAEGNVSPVQLAPFSGDQPSITRTSLEHDEILSGHFWAELRVFLAVAKAKSFNRAAEILNSSQPTVARQVKRLQDLMGSQLFVPTREGVMLTPKGQELAAELSKLDHALFSLTNGLRAKQETEGVVRISITDGLNTFFVAPDLRRFFTQYPRVQCHFKSPVNFISLRENQTDLMIGFVPERGADYTTTKLGCLHFIPAASEAYISEYGLPTRKSLEQHLFLQSEMYAAKTGLWDEWNATAATGRIAHYCDNSLAYGFLVKVGAGIGLVATYALLDPTVVPLELMRPISVRMYAVALSDRLRSRPVRAAYEWLCDIFGNNNPWFNEELSLNNQSSRYDDGVKKLFNY
jgi:DNA-binding transcriptional LysR family regulator